MPGLSLPVVTHVDLRTPTTLTVRLLPGQILADLTGDLSRLAEGMGVAAVRVRPFRHGWVHVLLLPADPLAVTIPHPRPVPDLERGVYLGKDEDGKSITADLATGAHMIVQGATGSGKSSFLYSVLGQVASTPGVRVTGSDPTGLLLAPWPSLELPGPALGTSDPAAHVAVLEGLVAEMDRRVALIPADHDSLPLGADHPAVLVVLEEYPGLLRLLDAVDSKGLGKRIRAAVARLLAEGRKAGLRVIIVAQRADASIIGGYERGQASHRLSFRVDSVDALRMLHPNATPDAAGDHSTALPGIALLSAPGMPLTRLRAPHVDYRTYTKTIRSAGTR